MGLTEVWRLLARFALACFAMPASAQNGFRSTQPSPRVEYWQQRVITIDRELSDRATVEFARLVFLGDSITALSRRQHGTALVGSRLPRSREIVQKNPGHQGPLDPQGWVEAA